MRRGMAKLIMVFLAVSIFFSLGIVGSTINSDAVQIKNTINQTTVEFNSEPQSSQILVDQYGCDLLYKVDMSVVGKNCHPSNKTSDSRVIDVPQTGRHNVRGLVHRGNPDQCQTNEDFFLEVSNENGPATEDDADACAITTRVDDLGDFNFNAGNNEITMNTASECPPDDSPNSVSLEYVCIKYGPFCGNGVVESGEQCDDGNTISGDGCSATCQIEKAYLTVIKEVINDDGGTKGVSDFRLFIGNNQVTSGVKNTLDPGNYVVSEQQLPDYASSIRGACDGDGTVTLNHNDDKTCVVSNNDIRIVEQHICGDGIKQNGEECDDGNTENGDGCSSACDIEGSIRVCKVVIDPEGNIVDGSAAPSTTFLIPGIIPNQTSSFPPEGLLPTSEFDTPLSFNADLFGNDQVNDAECVLHAGLSLGSWYYDEETIIDSGAWEDPKYNDQHTVNVSTTNDFYDYDPTLFDGNSSNDYLRNTNADADIFLMPQRPHRTLVVMNQYRPPECGNNILENGEQCDDGNNLNGDGCSSTCQLEEAKLIVVKHVINDNSGAAIASNFTINVTANNASPSSFPGNEGGTNVTLNPGNYSVTETNLFGYSAIFENCTGSINFGQTKTCIITNNDIPARLIVNKIVINDNGGNKTVPDFQLFIDNISVVSSATNNVTPGLRIVSEINQSGYTATISGDCSSNGSVSVALGQTRICNITNDDVPAKLRVIKNVINDNGGSKNVSSFTLFIDNVTVTNGTLNIVSAGTHIISELQDPNYTAAISGDCSSNGTVSVALGQTKVCNITNNDIPARLIVIKNVINDNGGTAAPSNFTINVSGNNVNPSVFLGSSLGTNVTLNTGNYSVSEIGPGGYVSNFSDSCSGNITTGQTKICNITNDDIASKLKVVKIVVNDNGRNKTVSDFPLFIDNISVVSNVSNVVLPGLHIVSEIQDPNYTFAISGDCSANGTVSLQTGQNKTCTITNDDTGFCGNGIVESGEQCDDGNNNNGDGCSAACEVEVCVDDQDPNTTKTYGQPFFTNGTSEWINSSTPVTLNATDNLVCPSDVTTFYRTTLLETDLPCLSNNLCQLLNGTNNFSFYASPFNIPERSCHLIEFFSNDSAGNNEQVKKQCVFVDNTEPVSVATVGQPKIPCLDDKSGCEFWVRDHVTEIKLSCRKGTGEPHPAPFDKLQWRFNIDSGNFTEWFEVNATNGTKIIFQEDSLHTLQYTCNDTLGNQDDIKTKIFKVDSTPPLINKTVVGPQYGICPPQNGTCIIDGVTKIHVEAQDTGPHPIGGVTCDWQYAVVNQSVTGGAQNVTPPFDINFPEESTHLLAITCKDALGNNITDVETFFVDKTPPVTSKEYVGPFHSDDGIEWISTETNVTLSAEDPEPHSSGVAATYWRNTLVDDTYCDGLNDNDDLLNCNNATGSGSWNLYTGPFQKEEESCHLIEFYSVDNVNKTEQTKRQCVFVDDTPPLPNKTVGEPREIWEGDNTFYPNLTQRCWATENGIDCWKVTMDTPITLDCNDEEPHPSDNEKVCFNVELDGDDVTEDYCAQHGGEINVESCCLPAPLTFSFGEESQHNLKFFCEDALGNKGPADEEKFKVEGMTFDIHLNKKWNLISVPFVLFNSSIDNVFDDIAANISSVWTYDNGTWLIWKPTGNNTLHEIVPGMGYWVLAKGKSILKVSGSMLSPIATPPNKNIQEGWNLIGYYGNDGKFGKLFKYDGPDMEGRKAVCELGSLVDTTLSVPEWSSLLTYWEPFADKWVELEFEERMDPGAGYWLEINEDEFYSPSTACPSGFEE